MGDLNEIVEWSNAKFDEDAEAKDNINRAFARYFPESDTDKDGYLSIGEVETFGNSVQAAMEAASLLQTLEEEGDIPRDKLHAMFAEADRDQNSKLDLNEIVEWSNAKFDEDAEARENINRAFAHY